VICFVGLRHLSLEDRRAQLAKSVNGRVKKMGRELMEHDVGSDAQLYKHNMFQGAVIRVPRLRFISITTTRTI
jgi:hypothetical protein